MKNKNGNVLLLVTITMLVLLIMVPALIRYVMDDAKGTAKISSNTKAFHLAETALERGYQTILLSTSTLGAVRAGTVVANFNFDTTYTDPTGGQYRIRFSSGTGGSVIIAAVGRSADGKEVRGLRAEYVVTGEIREAINAQGTLGFGGNSKVEWAPVISRSSITGANNYPRLYSAGAIDGKDSDPALPNSDNTQYWAYKNDLPDMPSLNLTTYQTQALALGATSAECGGTFYNAGDVTFKGCEATGTWYIMGKATFKAGSGGNYLVGTVVVLGNLEVQGSGGTHENLVVPLPPTAWEEYGNDWNHYKAWDAAAPASYAAAKTANYTAATNVTINNILVNGLMYVNGNVEFTGSGNSAVYGVAIVQGAPALGSTFDFYFNPTAAAAALTTTRGLQRVSWRDLSCQWTGASAPVCQ